MLVIVDYGAGNVGSIANMLLRAGVDAKIGNSAASIESAGKLILPGVGAFDSVMSRFSESGLVEAVLARLKAGVPILGICVGMQIMSTGSDEGILPGLGLVRARTRSLRSMINDQATKIPHMGWNRLSIRKTCPLLRDLPPEAKFYFVHSFAVVCDQPAECVASTTHGNCDQITAVIQHDNLYGVQFHPEKSRMFGLNVLRNFASFC